MRATGAAGMMLCAVLASQPAWAQGDEIVVTASRYQERFESDRPPHVAIVRRADFVIATLSIESDTRDLGVRRSELGQTLGDLAARARSGLVSAALIEESEDEAGDVRIKPYTVETAQALIRNGARPDTSRLQVVLRTKVQPADTLDAIESRLDAFVRGLPKPGRVTLGLDDPQLTITDPGQYRTAIIAAIAADARRATDALGAGYGVTITGLQNRIAWRRSSDLELTLYIDHALTVEPVRPAN